MAFELLFRSRRDDQIGHLRWQKTSQPAHPFDLTYLVGNALFEFLIEFDNFLGSLAQIVQEARVLDGYHCLARKVLHQRDLLVGEWAHLLAKDADEANQFAILDHWYVKQGSDTAQFHADRCHGIAREIRLIGTIVSDVDGALGSDQAIDGI